MGVGRWKYFLGMIFCLLLLNCKNESHLSSNNFPEKNERIETLQKHVKFFSEVEDAEFDLFDVNGFEENFFSIPGSSNWDLKFVVKVKPEDISKWTEGFVEFSPHLVSNGWMETLIRPRKGEWVIESLPIYYQRDSNNDVQLIVYQKEGIIFKRIYQN